MHPVLSRWLERARPHAHWLTAAACGTAAIVVVDWSPPGEIRVESREDPVVLGASAAAPEQAPDVPTGQVQLRATLRHVDDPQEVSHLDSAPVLSQPSVATLEGVNADIDQTVVLEGGDLRARVNLRATPLRRRKQLLLEYALSVTSERSLFWQQRSQSRLHLQSAGVLSEVERAGHRVVFAIDDHVFALELELSGAGGTSVLAGSAK